MKKLITFALIGSMIMAPNVAASEESDVANLKERIETLESEVNMQLNLIGTMYEIGKQKGLWGELQDEMANLKLNQNTPSETDTVSAPADTLFEYGGCSLQYVSSELAKDYKGNDVLVVYFDFVNNSGTDKAACFEFQVQAFQNGKENTGIPIMHPTIQEHNDGMAQVMSGAAPVRIAFIEPLADMSDVIIRVSPLISLGDEHLDIPITLQ